MNMPKNDQILGFLSLFCYINLNVTFRKKGGGGGGRVSGKRQNDAIKNKIDL